MSSLLPLNLVGLHLESGPVDRARRVRGYCPLMEEQLRVGSGISRSGLPFQRPFELVLLQIRCLIFCGLKAGRYFLDLLVLEDCPWVWWKLCLPKSTLML